jgi:putative ABC transport system permease protein
MAVGFIGYGIGVGLVAMIGNAVLRLGNVPFLLLWHVPAAALLAVMFISALAAVLGIWRVARLEPAIVFR